jgi:hypothetical protein
MRITFFMLFISIGSFLSQVQKINISGSILDFKTKKPIEFVNIGIFNKNKGTVSNQNGTFTLNLSKEFQKDSLTISHINYYSVKIAVENIKNKTVYLQPKTNELSEIVLSNKKKRKRKIGVKTYNPLLWLNGISENNDIIENAQRINIPDKTVRIKYVNVYLRKGFDTDSSFVRVNFYKNVENAPGERIVFKNILQKKQLKYGWLQIDVRENDVYIKEDFFVGVEFIPNFKKPLNVYIGAILTKGKGYSRRSSQGKWNKIQGASSINVELEY